MMTALAMAPAPPATTWIVQVEATLPAPRRSAPAVDELEPVVELLYRTEGVRSVRAEPRLGGLAVTVGLSAPDANVALRRARTLVGSCARYAGLGEVTIDRVQVTPRRDVAEAWRVV
jgi:hypothetical protein